MNDKFIFRTPLLPLDNLFRLMETLDEIEFINILKSEYSNQNLRAALYISSPVLYNELLKADNDVIKWKSSNFYSSLLKYYIRSCTRCTPYGLFASVNIGNMTTDKSEIKILSSNIHAHLRIDFGFLDKIYQDFKNKNSFLSNAVFYVNNSLYKIGNQYRYIEYVINNNKRIYSLTSVKIDSILKQIIKKASYGIKLSELISLCMSYEYSAEESETYIRSLIKAQILIDDITPNICGIEYQDRLFHRLSLISEHNEFHDEVSRIGEDISKNVIEKGQELHKLFTQNLSSKIEDGVFLKADSSKESCKTNLNIDIKNKILEATVILAKLQEPYFNFYLDKFKKAFSERYETEEVNLLEVLDSDIGIGYNKDLKNKNFDLMTNSWTNQSRFKLELLKMSYLDNSNIVYIDENKLNKCPLPSIPLPDSTSFFGSLINLPEKGEYRETILFNALLGPSAINLIGRFGHLSEDIKSLCISLAKEEEQKHPNKIFASISHIPQGRQGNVLIRDQYRNYEIPYLTHSLLPKEQQIIPADLTISLKNNRLVLKSKTKNKEVIPRNDNSHNYRNNTLPFYQFLSYMQHQDLNGTITWDWGLFSSEKFLPRVVYKNIILTLARWNIESKDLAYLLNSSLETKRNSFKELKNSYNLPDYVQLIEGDNLLLLYLKSAQCIEILIGKSKKYKTLTLTEYIFSTENCSLIRDEKLESYTNEIIVPIVKPTKTKFNETFTIKNHNLIQSKTRAFIPFSEWLYLKLYCSFSASDSILKTVVYQLINSLKKDKLIIKWFFIRYDDTNHHLRIRLQVNNTDNIIQLYRQVYEKLNKLISSYKIWNIQIDTYKREIERYGNDTIEITEEFFSVNSDTVCLILKRLKQRSVELKTMIGLLGVHCLLNDFGLNKDEKIVFLNHMISASNLKRTKNVRKQIKEGYRNHKELIWKILYEPSFTNETSANSIYIDIYKIYKLQSSRIRKYVFANSNNTIKTALLNNLGSYTHMFINRLFDSNQNNYEYLIYEYLQKTYSSEDKRRNLQD